MKFFPIAIGFDNQGQGTHDMLNRIKTMATFHTLAPSPNSALASGASIKHATSTKRATMGTTQTVTHHLELFYKMISLKEDFSLIGHYIWGMIRLKMLYIVLCIPKTAYTLS